MGTTGRPGIAATAACTRVTNGRRRSALKANAANRSREAARKRALARGRTTTRWLAGALVLLLLVGCSSFDDGDGVSITPTDSRAGADSGAPDALAPQDDMDDAATDDADEMESTEDGEVRPIASGAPTGRKIIRTAELVLETSDTSEALGRIRAIAERAGGYTATTDLQRDEDGIVRGTLTLRVPTSELSSVVEELEELGESVPVNRIDERDVTTEHADLQARIENLTAYETELRALLTEIRESTDRPEDLLHIFERIRQVREEIDLIEGRMAAMSDQISYATVTVTLRPIDEDGGSTGEEASPWAPGETFSDALAATGRFLAAFADGIIWFVVTGVPVLVSFLAVPALVAYLIVRWYRRRPQRPEDAPYTPQPPVGPETTGAPPTT